MGKISLDNLFKSVGSTGWANLFAGGQTTGAQNIPATVTSAAAFQGMQDMMLGTVGVSDPYIRQMVQGVLDELSAFQIPAAGDYANITPATAEAGFRSASEAASNETIPLKRTGVTATEAGAFYDVSIATQHDARWGQKRIGEAASPKSTYARKGCLVFALIDNRRLLDAKNGKAPQDAGKLLGTIENTKGAFTGKKGTALNSDLAASQLDMQIVKKINAERSPQLARDEAQANLESGGVLIVGINHTNGRSKSGSPINRETDHFTSASAMCKDADGNDVVYLRDPNAKGSAAEKNATIPMTFNPRTNRFEGPNGWTITEIRTVREKVD